MSVSLKFLIAGSAKFTGTHVTFTFETKQTIAEVKESIVRQWPEHLREVDIARKKIKIVHSGSVLDDKQTLQDCNFVDTDTAPTLHLMLQPMLPQEEQKSSGAGAAEQPGGKPVGRCCVIA